ncbi:MAG: hypothetical protein J2P57_05950 [Acidimicrobiaceae bacterium]|nr:hypothetical protein [Acidimicrobiaceae bacterium]
MPWHQFPDDTSRAVNHLARSTPYLHAPHRLYAEERAVLFGALLFGVAVTLVPIRRPLTAVMTRAGRTLLRPLFTTRAAEADPQATR